MSTVSSSHTSLKLCPTCRPTKRLYVCGRGIGADCRCRSASTADTCGTISIRSDRAFRFWVFVISLQ